MSKTDIMIFKHYETMRRLQRAITSQGHRTLIVPQLTWLDRSDENVNIVFVFVSVS
jgi:hypothetical protein